MHGLSRRANESIFGMFWESFCCKCADNECGFVYLRLFVSVCVMAAKDIQNENCQQSQNDGALMMTIIVMAANYIADKVTEEDKRFQFRSGDS